jgi:hypothetical protein
MGSFRLILICCLAVFALQASTITGCTAQPLSTYLQNQTACQVDGLEFSDFSYGPNHFPQHPGPPASSIMVAPLADFLDPGLMFSSLAWTAEGAGGGGDSTISYLVTSVSGAPIIQGAALGMNAVVTSNPVKLIVGETVCVGVMIPPGQCPSANTVNLQLADTPTPISQIPDASFGPVSEITVLKDIYFASEGATGSGQIFTVSNTYPVPETATVLLSLMGLVTVAAMRRKRTG